MKHFKRILCLLLTLCLCVGLFGCSKGSGGKNTTSTADLHVYKSTEVDTKLDAYANSFSNDTVIVGDRIYLIGYIYDDSETGVQYKLLSVGLDGSDPQAAPLELEPIDPEKQSADPTGLLADESGNLYLLERVYNYGTQEADWTDSGSAYYLDQLGADGAILSRTLIDNPDDNYLDASSAVCINDSFYFAANGSIAVVPLDGSTVQWLTVLDGSSDATNGNINSLFRQGDTLMCVYYGGESWTCHLAPVDLNSGKLGTELKLPSNLDGSLFSDPNGKLYMQSSNGISSVDVNTGTTTLLCTWLDSDIDQDSSIQALYAMADGTFLATGNGENWDKFILTTLSYVDPTTLPEKTILRLGCIYSWNVQREVLKFNRASDTVRITLVDYSQYNSEENQWSGAATQLNTDIISGNVPDILLVDSSLPFQSYANKGLFTDLYPLLDADPNLSRDDFLSNILQASETDGKLTSIIPYYDVMSVAAPASMVDSATGWTWDEFQAVLQQYPNIQYAIPFTTRDTILNMALILSGNQYVDYETGTCHFDSPAFQQLLEYVSTYPAETNNNDIQDSKSLFTNGSALLETVYLYDFTSIRNTTYDMNGPIVYKGFPTTDGTGGSAIVPYLQLAISESCTDKTAAWELISYFLTQEYQDSVGGDLPLRVDSLQKLADKAMNPDDSGIIGGAVTYSINGGSATVTSNAETGEAVAIDPNGNATVIGSEVDSAEDAEGTANAGNDIATDDVAGDDLSSEDYWNRPVTQAEIDQMMELIRSCKSVYQWDQNLLSIVSEEVAAFFNGSKTAADTAAIIQNRASTYLSESR